MDHRLGPDPRVRRLRRRRRGRLGRLIQHAARPRFWSRPSRGTVAASRGRRPQPAGGIHRDRDHGATRHRRARERPHQHDHGVHQGRGARDVHRARPDRAQRRQLHALLHRRLQRHVRRRFADLSSPTSASTRSRPRPRRSGTRAARCRGRYRLTRDRDGALHPGRGRDDRAAADRPAQGPGGAAWPRTDRGCRLRVGGGRAHALLWPEPDPVRDVPRRAAAAVVREGCRRGGPPCGS